jgi:hypothetical protein
VSITATAKPLTVERRVDDLLVIRHRGGSAWRRIGEPHARVPSQFLIFRVLKEMENSTGEKELTVEEITSFNVRESKKIPATV